MPSPVEGVVPAAGLTEACRESLLEAFKESDDKEALRAALKSMLRTNPDVVLAVGRRGHRARMDGEKVMVTNFGVVAALVLSVVAGMAASPLEAIAEDDGWSDNRAAMAKLYLVLVSVSGILALSAVGLSISYLATMELFIHDLDDFLWFFRIVPTSLVIAPVVIANIVLAVAMGLAVVVLLPDPWATVGFVLDLVVFAILTIMAGIWFFVPLARCNRAVAASQERWEAAIDAAFDAAVAAAAAAAAAAASAGPWKLEEVGDEKK